MNIFAIISLYLLNRSFKMKRREVEKAAEEREDADARQKKAEADELYNVYQEEKNRKRAQEAQALTNHLLKQAVSCYEFFKQR